MSVQQLQSQLRVALSSTVFGMDKILPLVTIAVVARGHILLEAYPGLGKTLFARALAKALGGSFGRIQCTADLMPSDMTGVHVFNDESRRFELIEGPLFADVVLVDEINRTGPKTQSAMLQAMEERAITIDREHYLLAPDFLVIATQNPHDFEGTYPLPESQIDRFLMKIQLDYPEADDEIEVLRSYDRASSRYEDKVSGISSIDNTLITAARAEADQVHVAPAIYEFARSIAVATRQSRDVDLGLSTRGLLALMTSARVAAAMDRKDHVTPDHVKTIAPFVIAHRLLPAADALLAGEDPMTLTMRLLRDVPVPRTEPEAG
jgi:MoxR-like ATPase